MTTGCENRSRGNAGPWPRATPQPNPPKKAPRIQAATIRRKMGLLFLLLLLVSCAQVPGSGKLAQKIFRPGEFRNVFLVGQGNLELVQGAEEIVAVEAETNILPRIQAYVENENLWIRFERDNWPDVIRPTRPISFRVTFQHLETIRLQGQGNIHAAEIDVSALLLQADGSGRFRIDRLRADRLSLRINGWAEMVLAGTATRQEIAINGSGWIRNEQLNSRDVRIRINGSGNVRLQADETLDAEINGSGKVTYSGRPEAVTRVHGTGKIIHQRPATGYEMTR